MWRKRILQGVGFLLLACVVGCWGLWFAFYRPIIPKGEVGEVQFEKRVEQLDDGEKREYEIGVFFVPENRSNPDSRVIAIDYARFPAKDEKGPPIFLLPGGPGGTYVGKAPAAWKIPHLERLRAFSDVVLMNQRGYNPHRRDVIAAWRSKTRPKPDDTLEDRVSDYIEFAKYVRSQYEDSNVDLRGYTIIECAGDVNDLRKALGYDRIMLMGQSFGSQWCFAVMRKHPEIVERAILTGVEPLNNTHDMPSHLMHAVRRIWKHLDTDPEWVPFLPPGGMEEAAESVFTRLENSGIEVKGDNGETVSLLGPDDFPWDYPAKIVELFHGNTDRWKSGRKPNGGYLDGKLIFPLIDSSTGVTADRRKKLLDDPSIRYVSQNNFFASFLATADIWPSPDVGDDFRIPIQCDIPVVFMHGNWDRYTPVENTLEIAPFFPNSHTLLIERGGHDPFLQMGEHPEVLTALMKFAETGSTDAIPDKITIKPDLGHNKDLPRLDPATLK